jgi:hypothetical protein
LKEGELVVGRILTDLKPDEAADYEYRAIQYGQSIGQCRYNLRNGSLKNGNVDKTGEDTFGLALQMFNLDNTYSLSTVRASFYFLNIVDGCRICLGLQAGNSKTNVSS